VKLLPARGLAGEHLGIDIAVPALVTKGTDNNNIRKKRDIICLIKILNLCVTYRAWTGYNGLHYAAPPILSREILTACGVTTMYR
jgi:hypothetical protein